MKPLRHPSPQRTFASIMAASAMGSIMMPALVVMCQTALLELTKTSDQLGFARPLFQSFGRFLGMSLCLLPCLLGCAGSSPFPGRHVLCKLAPPAALALLGSLFGCLGTVLAPAGLVGLADGSGIVFAGFFSVALFRRPLQGRKLTGTVFAALGVFVAGAAAQVSGGVSPDHSSLTVLLGFGLEVGRQACLSFRLVYQEWLVKDLALHPLIVIGSEGFYALMVIAVVFLGSFSSAAGDVSLVEGLVLDTDVGHSLELLQGQPSLIVMQLAFVVVLGLINYITLVLAHTSGSVLVMMVMNVSTGAVLVMDLVLYYSYGPELGAPWGASSYMELCGFVVLLVGVCLYYAADSASSLRAKNDCAGEGCMEVGRTDMELGEVEGDRVDGDGAKGGAAQAPRDQAQASTVHPQLPIGSRRNLVLGECHTRGEVTESHSSCRQ